MSDKKTQNPHHNIRGLVQDLAERLDDLANRHRENTAFAGTRPADAKTFMLISRNPRGLTDLARAQGISRQAAHKSIQRLVAAGVISYDYVSGSQRDMIATLTEKGLQAQKVGLQIAAEVDAFIASRIGLQGAAQLRDYLVQILEDRPA